MGEKKPFKIRRISRMENSALLIAWDEDASKLGGKVSDYLIERLGGVGFAEIEPEGFFPLAGVSVDDNIVHFPECRFFYCRRQNLVICKSSPPRSNWFRFMDLVLKLAERYCDLREVYTFGAMVSLSAHTAERSLLAVANSPEMREDLLPYDLVMDIDYETAPGQRPTLSSFLLWVAQKRGLAAASLWVPVPFYLLTNEDPRAWKRILEFLDRKLRLGLDFSALDEDIASQDRRISQIASRSPLLSHYLRRLQSNLSLTQEENEKLVKEIEQFLKEQ
ncbi:MAG: PAC2 family protein [Dehalococcoidia bacterium]|nr:PAC2 family protein [Dehalococcoidia bacterium]